MPKRVFPKLAPPILSEHLPPDFVLEVPEELSRHNRFLDAKGVIKRPQNSFFIMRTEFQRQIAGSVSQSLVSKLAAALWNEMSYEKKKPWYALAQKLQNEHRAAFPGYVYKPSSSRRRKRKKVMVYEDDSDNDYEFDEMEDDGGQSVQNNRSKMAEGQSITTPQLMRGSTARLMARPYPTPSQTQAYVRYASAQMQNGSHQGYYYLPGVYGRTPMQMLPIGVVPNTNYLGPTPGNAQHPNFSQQQMWYHDQVILQATHRLQMEAEWSARRAQQPQGAVESNRYYPSLAQMQNSLRGTAEPASMNSPLGSSTMHPSQAAGPSNATTMSHYKFSPTLSASSKDIPVTATPSPLTFSFKSSPATTPSASSHNTTNHGMQPPAESSGDFNFDMALPGQNNVFPVWPDMDTLNSDWENPLPLPFPLRTAMEDNTNMTNVNLESATDNETDNSNFAISNYTMNQAATSSDPVIDPQLLEPQDQTESLPQSQTLAMAHDSGNVEDDVQSILNDVYKLGEAFSHTPQSFSTASAEQSSYQVPLQYHEGLSSGFIASMSRSPSNGTETQMFQGSGFDRLNCHDPDSGRELTLNDFNNALGAAWASGSSTTGDDREWFA